MRVRVGLAGVLLLSGCGDASRSEHAVSAGAGASAAAESSGPDSDSDTDDASTTGVGSATNSDAASDSDSDAASDSDSDSGSAADSDSTTDSDSDSDSGTGTGTGTGSESGTDSDSDSDTGAVGVDACGFPLDGPWVEIEYSQAGGSPQSPSWTFSDTPGWGGAQWATQGESWPEVWDLFQNINVSNDPIGVLAVVGPSAELQLMIGLQDLVSYSSATVCVEGRSVSTSASVIFDAYNPLTGCGESASMAHDWSMHAVGLDLTGCFVEGGGVQAVRIEPTGGSSAIGVKRMRLILHGASF